MSKYILKIQGFVRMDKGFPWIEINFNLVSSVVINPTMTIKGVKDRLLRLRNFFAINTRNHN